MRHFLAGLALANRRMPEYCLRARTVLSVLQFGHGRHAFHVHMLSVVLVHGCLRILDRGHLPGAFFLHHPPDAYGNSIVYDPNRCNKNIARCLRHSLLRAATYCFVVWVRLYNMLLAALHIRLMPLNGIILEVLPFSCVSFIAAINALMSDLVAGAGVVVAASSNSTASAVVRNASAV